MGVTTTNPTPQCSKCGMPVDPEQPAWKHHCVFACPACDEKWSTEGQALYCFRKHPFGKE